MRSWRLAKFFLSVKLPWLSISLARVLCYVWRTRVPRAQIARCSSSYSYFNLAGRTLAMQHAAYSRKREIGTPRAINHRVPWVIDTFPNVLTFSLFASSFVVVRVYVTREIVWDGRYSSSDAIARRILWWILPSLFAACSSFYHFLISHLRVRKHSNKQASCVNVNLSLDHFYSKEEKSIEFSQFSVQNFAHGRTISSESVQFSLQAYVN